MSKIKIFLFLILFSYTKAQSQTIDTLVNIGNHKLYFEIIKGNNTPIIFESGNGNDGSVWKPILQSIYKKTGATLITYDRTGLGKSEIDTTKISFKQEVKNLNKALKKLGYKGNYFLVAHSFGAFYASELVQINKGKVIGAVFIDPSTPCMITEKWATNYIKELSSETWAMLKKHRIGLYYVLQNFPGIADYMSTRFISTDIPLTLIIAENLPNENTLKTEEDKLNWVKCLKEFGNLPNHKYVLAKNTDHMVWEKDPKTVIEEITKLYLKVNK